MAFSLFIRMVLNYGLSLFVRLLAYSRFLTILYLKAPVEKSSNKSAMLCPFVSVSAMLVSMRQKNIAQVSILERYFFVSTYQAAGPDTCLAVFVVASLPPCL